MGLQLLHFIFMPDAAEGVGNCLPEKPHEPAESLQHRHLIFLARGPQAELEVDFNIIGLQHGSYPGVLHNAGLDCFKEYAQLSYFLFCRLIFGI